jgi:hypothetical protein
MTDPVACSGCGRVLVVVIAMEPGRDGAPYNLCVKCYFFRTPYRPPVADPAPVPSADLKWEGGAHYVPDGEQFW